MRFISKYKTILLISAIFLAVSVPNLEYDPLDGDEIVPGSLAVSLLQGSASGRNTSLYLHFSGYALPVNRLCDYDFALPAYILLPVFKVFGAHIVSIRLTAIAISLLYLIFLFAVTAKIFDKRTAFLTTLFLALNPLFVHYARGGFNTTEPIINLLFTAGIFFFLTYLSRRNPLFLGIAFLLAGACFSVKLSCLSRFIGLAAGLTALYRNETAAFLRGTGARRLSAAALCFIAGAFLFVYYNSATGGKTFSLARHLLLGEPTVTGERNSMVAKHAWERMQHLASFMHEDVPVMPGTTDKGRGPAQTALMAVGGAAFFGMFYLAGIARDPRRRKVIYGICIFFAAMFLTTFFSPGSWRPFHLAIMFPFPQLAAALCVVMLFDLQKERAWGKSIAIIVLAVVLMAKGTLLYSYHASLAQFAQEHYPGEHSMRSLIDYMDQNGMNPYYIINFNTNEAAFFIVQSKGNNMPGWFGIPGKRATFDFLDRELKPGKSEYVVTTPRSNPYELDLRWLVGHLHSRHKNIEKVYSLNDKNGRDLYVIYRIY